MATDEVSAPAVTETGKVPGELCMSIRSYWSANHDRSRERDYAICPRLKCADGFSMSVQANSAAYCIPRQYVESGDYAEFEIGYPSEAEPLIHEWIEDASRPTDTVYGYVPTAVIDAVIAKHGGIVGQQSREEIEAMRAARKAQGAQQ